MSCCEPGKPRNPRSPVARMHTAVKGAVTIAAAEIRGDRTPLPQLKARLDVCAVCPTMQMHNGRMWCGEPFVETEISCGCRCDLKARIRSERCPQRKWPGDRDDDSTGGRSAVEA